MSLRVLLADPDWELLKLAFRTLRDAGNEVVIEAGPEDAMRLAVQWRPNVIICPAECLDFWEAHHGEDFADLRSRCSVLVTAPISDPDCPWRKWADRGHEVLLKPLVHPSELSAAIERSV